MSSQPPLVPFNIAATRQAAIRLRELMLPYAERPLVGLDFDEFVENIRKRLRLAPTAAVFVSLMHLAGTPLTPATIEGEAWRLAANLKKLRAGRPVLPWVAQRDLEWVAARIVSAEPTYDSSAGKSCFRYGFQILSGGPAYMTIYKNWSTGMAKFTAGRIGFTRRTGSRYRLHTGYDLVRMLLYLLVDPAQSGALPGFSATTISSKFKSANREILKMRARVIPCPAGYSLAEMPCHKCHVGFVECPAAVHRHSWTVKVCPRCRLDGWFDPDSVEVICITCQRGPKDAHHEAAASNG